MDVQGQEDITPKPGNRFFYSCLFVTIRGSKPCFHRSRVFISPPAIPLFLLLVVLFLLPACRVTYLFHAAAGQYQLLRGSVPIEEALHHHALTPEQQERLALVPAIKAFGESELGLRKTKNYETVYLGEKRHVLFTLSAAPKDRLQLKTWWFPIVGAMPYLGFFDRESVLAKKERLQEEDLDVSIGMASAYSTLGWFQDPVTPNLLGGTTPYLVETILHEMTHATLYLKGQGAFNEGLALLVGKVGALLFLKKTFGPEHPFTNEARGALEDERAFSAYLGSFLKELESLYDSDHTYKEKVEKREHIFQDALNRFETLREGFKTNHFTRFGERGLNNAYILSISLYHQYFHLFEAALEARDGSVSNLLMFLKEMSQEGGDMMKEMEGWLGPRGENDANGRRWGRR